MKPYPKITIGIPVLNEGQNIINLIKSLLKQKIRKAELEKIIIISDASTDDTEKKIKSIKDFRLIFMNNKRRLGLNKSQNKILSNSNSNILILLDGDVLPFGDAFIQNIISPILNNPKIGLVAAKNISIPQQTFFGSIIEFSHKLKTDMYENINRGCNVYSCYGRARAFSKEFYSDFKWPDNVPEDAYSYFESIRKGFVFYSSKKAKIFFSVPGNLKDHRKQSVRFFNGKFKLKRFFQERLIRKEYAIPFGLILRTSIKYFIKSPHKLVIYFIISGYLKIFSFRANINHSRYDLSSSTKKLWLKR